MINQVKKTRFSKEKSDYVQLSRAYLKKIPLTDNKKKDLQDLADKNIIPKYYYNSFFKMFSN